MTFGNRRAIRLHVVLAVAMALAGFGLASPAHADCLFVHVETPHLETKSDGRVIVQGYAEALCPGGAQLSVCLDYNLATRVDTCQTYGGEFPSGQTTETPCLIGVWHTMAVAVPNSGPPQVAHSGALIVTPFNCPARVN